VRIDIAGITLRGLHGVLEHERRDGQSFVFDVVLELDDPVEDDIDATVDYRDVVACVREVSDGTAFQLLESLAVAVAEELMRRFPLAGTSVTVGKPELDLEGGRATVTAAR
jgi:dihydroneopterin aldolase